MTLCDPDLDFKVTILFDVKLVNGTSKALLTMADQYEVVGLYYIDRRHFLINFQ